MTLTQDHLCKVRATCRKSSKFVFDLNLSYGETLEILNSLKDCIWLEGMSWSWPRVICHCWRNAYFLNVSCFVWKEMIKFDTKRAYVRRNKVNCKIIIAVRPNVFYIYLKKKIVKKICWHKYQNRYTKNSKHLMAEIRVVYRSISVMFVIIRI